MRVEDSGDWVLGLRVALGDWVWGLRVASLQERLEALVSKVFLHWRPPGPELLCIRSDTTKTDQWLVDCMVQVGPATQESTKGFGPRLQGFPASALTWSNAR